MSINEHFDKIAGILKSTFIHAIYTCKKRFFRVAFYMSCFLVAAFI